MIRGKLSGWLSRKHLHESLSQNNRHRHVLGGPGTTEITAGEVYDRYFWPLQTWASVQGHCPRVTLRPILGTEQSALQRNITETSTETKKSMRKDYMCRLFPQIFPSTFTTDLLLKWSPICIMDQLSGSNGQSVMDNASSGSALLML